MPISLATIARASQVTLGACARSVRSGHAIDHEWAPDLEAITRACEHLRVTAPIVIQIVRYDRRTSAHARHRCRAGVHYISVAYWHTPQRASELLWHELTHAAQYARGERPNTSRVRKTQGFDAYFAHPAEVEARAGERNHDWLPLAH